MKSTWIWSGTRTILSSILASLRQIVGMILINALHLLLPFMLCSALALVLILVIYKLADTFGLLPEGYKIGMGITRLIYGVYLGVKKGKLISNTEAEVEFNNAMNKLKKIEDDRVANEMQVADFRIHVLPKIKQAMSDDYGAVGRLAFNIANYSGLWKGN